MVVTSRLCCSPGLLVCVFTCLLLSACATPQPSILPSHSDRNSLADYYMRCVSNVTRTRYDNTSDPAEMVQSAMNECIAAKRAMLQAYPSDWQQKMEQDVDEKVYRREMAWIEHTRKKGGISR